MRSDRGLRRWNRPAQPQRMAAQEGFTYLMLLFAVAAMGLTLSGAGRVWQTMAQREREAELLFVGHQYRQAIARYHEESPGAARQYPLQLEDLLEDRRFPVPRRHLRQIYPDPMTGAADWVLLRQDGRIVGLHSRSASAALRTNFQGRDASLRGASRHDEWIFRHELQ